MFCFALFLWIFSDHSLAYDTQRFNPKAILAIHNYYRCMHGTQPLTWNNTLQASAEKWAAVRQADNCIMLHSHYPGVGENVAAGSWVGLSDPSGNYWYSDLDVPHAWYNETWDYDYLRGPGNSSYNHFSQIIWNGSSSLGCAWVPCDSAQYEFWVCQFWPQGNIIGWEPFNVPPPCRPSDQCMAALQDVNLTAKYASKQSQDESLYPNCINTATYKWPTAACAQYSAAMYGSTIPGGGGPNNTGMAVGVTIAVLLVVVAGVIGFVYLKRKRTGYQEAALHPRVASLSTPNKGASNPNATSPSSMASPSAVSSPATTPPPYVATPSSPPGNHGWTKQYDDNSKQHYYFHEQTGTTQWDKPVGFPE